MQKSSATFFNGEPFPQGYILNRTVVPGAKVAVLLAGHALQLAAPKILADCLIPWLQAVP
jgi:hypothetical protein